MEIQPTFLSDASQHGSAIDPIHSLGVDLSGQLLVLDDKYDEKFSYIQQKYGFTSSIAHLLSNRCHSLSDNGIENFIFPKLSCLLDPFLLKDMDKLIARVDKALANNENIVIYGDYDTDGITATSILILAFRIIGKEISYHIPNRLDEGYGVNKEAIDVLKSKNANLIITVDTGISAHDEIAHANSLGIDIIVTDHHIPTIENNEEILPPALAVINPKRKDCKYPNKYLAGVGVAFKIAQALLKTHNVPYKKAQAFLKDMLCFVTLGTIADNAPLVEENRAIVSFGLRQLKRTTLPSIAGIRKALNLENKIINSKIIGFKIAPRLNAAGRTFNAGICVELLISNDPQMIAQYMNKLERLNEDRKEMERTILNEAQEWIDKNIDQENEPILVVSGKEWHLGVIGIVASRLMEKYHKPCIVISVFDSIGKGSGRSTKEFNIHEALFEYKSQLSSFGGHNFAVGFQIPDGEIPVLRQEINRYANRLLRDHKYDKEPVLHIDAIIEAAELAGQPFIHDLQRIEPYGLSNQYPVFLIRKVYIVPNSISLTRNKKHLRFRFVTKNYEFYATAFNAAALKKKIDYLSSKNIPVNLAFTVNLQDYYSEPRLELDIKGIQPVYSNDSTATLRSDKARQSL